MGRPHCSQPVDRMRQKAVHGVRRGGASGRTMPAPPPPPPICWHAQPGTSNALICRPRSMRARPADVPSVPVRLAGGATDSEGRVEVFRNGIWGRATGLNAAAATVLCKQLGKGTRGAVPSLPLFAPPTYAGVFWLAWTYCSGTEASLLDCSVSSTAYVSPDYTDSQVSCMADQGEACVLQLVPAQVHAFSQRAGRRATCMHMDAPPPQKKPPTSRRV